MYSTSEAYKKIYAHLQDQTEKHIFSLDMS